MKILAIDTSTSVMGIALMSEEKIYAETMTNLKINHSIMLMPTVDQMFNEVDWEPNDIDLVAVAKGPGSYTGVRIGVTTAKTYAWFLKVPLIGVSTLEAMAYSFKYYEGVISPIIDARRGQVYTGLYKNIDSKLINIQEDCIISLSDWLNMLQKNNEKVLFIGDDIKKHYEQLLQFDDLVKFGPIIFNIPRPSTVGLIAKEKYDNNYKENVYNFIPSYLQLAEAEKNLSNK